MKVLLVDDTTETRLKLVESLAKEKGWIIDSCEDVKSAMMMIKEFNYDLILTDLNMPISGLDFGEILDGHPPMLLYTTGPGMYGIEGLLKRYKIRGFIPYANLESIKDAVMDLFKMRVDENSKITNQMLGI